MTDGSNLAQLMLKIVNGRFQRLHVFRFCTFISCLLLLIGCAGHSRRDAPALSSANASIPGFPPGIRWFEETRQDFKLRSKYLLQQVQDAAGGEPANILVLSGGGSGAAFGAGALVGWSRSGTRPEFQIVTGVSAGALIAPLAFAGRDWDPKLTEAFSGIQTQGLMRTGWLNALFGTSVYQGEPLAQLVDRYVTADLVSAVARESKKGRLLLVATTNLDREQTVIWNLGLIAQQGGAKSIQLFRDVLIASASIPGIFPPMMIKVEQEGKDFEEMHVDGSAMAPLLFIPYVATVVPTELSALHDARLYVLVNGGFRTAEETTPKRTIAIVKRSAGATMQGGTRAALEIAYSVAQRHQMRVAVTEIPASYPYYGALDFDEPRMATLFRYGEHCGQIGQLWIDPFDALDQPPANALRDSSSTIDCPRAAEQ